MSFLQPISLMEEKKIHEEENQISYKKTTDYFSSKENQEENQIQRLPSELQYRVFARLECEDLLSEKSVCKEWHALLSESALQTLFKSMHPLSVSSPAFLVRMVCRAKDEDGALPREKRVLVSIDHEGRFQRHDIYKDLNISHDLIKRGNFIQRATNNISYIIKWDVSCNGMFCSFSSLLNYDSIAVCHPSLKWRASVPRHPDCKFPKEKNISAFHGAHYDPLTSHFSLLVGYPAQVGIECDRKYVLEIYIYNSVSRQWRIVTRDCQSLLPQSCTGLFSHGYYFWINRLADKLYMDGVVGFNCKDEQFHKIGLPECPLHPRNSSRCKGPIFEPIDRPAVMEYFWTLKGCHDNIILFHTGHSVFDIGRSFPPVAAWRLLILTEIGGNESGWQWQRIDLNSQSGLHSVFPAPCYHDAFSYFDTNKSGWWLWAEKCKPYEDKQTDLKIFDSQGVLRHIISMEDLASVLNVPENYHAIVDGVWPFETTNIWSLVASS